MDSAADRTFFVTTNTAGKRRLFQVSANAELLLGLLKEDRARGRYEVHAYVIMPDHIHLILTPAPEVSLEKAMQFIKWQESFAWERVKDARDFASHCDYIHANPVRKFLCEKAGDFEYSSARGVGVDAVPAYLRA
ncbi:MAG: transposase [Acidobacteriaceae bacterium]